jgi:hypothetical protein
MADSIPEQRAPKRKKRVFMWVFLAIQTLFIIWIIAGASNASDNCAGKVGDALKLCQNATGVGAGIGIFIIVFFWVMVDLILGITYLITRRR